MAEKVKGYNKTYTGVVVSDKMDKTIVVKVSTRKLHGLYKKISNKKQES